MVKSILIIESMVRNPSHLVYHIGQLGFACKLAHSYDCLEVALKADIPVATVLDTSIESRYWMGFLEYLMDHHLGSEIPVVFYDGREKANAFCFENLTNNLRVTLEELNYASSH